MWVKIRADLLIFSIRTSVNLYHFVCVHISYISEQQNDTNRHNSNLIQTRTIITLTKLVTPQALHQCLKFIYSGAIDMECTNLKVKLVK